MKKASLFVLFLGLLLWPLVMQGWGLPVTAVPYLTATPSPTSSCPTATATPFPKATPLPTATPCNFPPTPTPSPTSSCPTATVTPFATPTPYKATPLPTATPCNFPPTMTPYVTITPTPCPTCPASTPTVSPPTPTPWVTPVFWATAHVTASENSVDVGEVLTVTTSLTIAPGCVYPVLELSLSQGGDDAPIFAPESVFLENGIPMPNTITVTAVTSGTINFNVALFGERFCGDYWNWAWVNGQSAPVTVPSAPAGELPDLIISNITYNGGTPQCGTHPPDLGARVWVQNVGTASAAPFVVEVNNSQQQTVNGLAAGGQTSLVFGGALGSVTAVADPTNQIAESDESNNSFSTILPIPTLPPPCPPTPTAPYHHYLPITIK